MTTTLALEQLLLHPELAKIADYVRAAMPTALRDQADAAATHAHAGLNVISEVIGGGVVGLPTAEVPDWLRLGTIDAFVAHCLGTAATCLHNPDPMRPQPVVAAAWKPGYVVCARCIHLLALPRGGKADRTCDVCGRVCGGIEVDDGIYPSTVQLGPLLYQFGVCRECRPVWTAT